MNKTQAAAYLPRRVISFNDRFTTEHSIRSISSTLAARVCPAGTTCTKKREILINQSCCSRSRRRLSATITCSFFRSIIHTGWTWPRIFWFYPPSQWETIFSDSPRLFVTRSRHLWQKIFIVAHCMNNSQSIFQKISFLINFDESLSILHWIFTTLLWIKFLIVKNCILTMCWI